MTSSLSSLGGTAAAALRYPTTDAASDAASPTRTAAAAAASRAADSAPDAALAGPTGGGASSATPKPLRFPWLSRLSTQLASAAPQKPAFASAPVLGDHVDKQV